MPRRTPTESTPESRTAGLKDRLPDPSDPDNATEVLGEVDTRRPLGARDGEHGHIDGPRGLQDFHHHPGGDRPHPHPRPTQTIPRSADITEWIPPFDPAARPPTGDDADPIPAASVGDGTATPDVRASEPALAGGSGGAAGSGRPTSLERHDGSYPAIVVGVERLEATEAKIRMRLAEVEVVKALFQLTKLAADQLDYDDLVGPTVIAQMQQTVDRWAAGRGVVT